MTPEGKQLVDQTGRFVTSLHDLIETGKYLWLKAFTMTQQIGMADDGTEQIVELMGNAAGEQTYGFHFLSLTVNWVCRRLTNSLLSSDSLRYFCSPNCSICSVRLVSAILLNHQTRFAVTVIDTGEPCAKWFAQSIEHIEGGFPALIAGEQAGAILIEAVVIVRVNEAGQIAFGQPGSGGTQQVRQRLVTVVQRPMTIDGDTAKTAQYPDLLLLCKRLRVND